MIGSDFEGVVYHFAYMMHSRQVTVELPLGVRIGL